MAGKAARRDQHQVEAQVEARQRRTHRQQMHGGAGQTLLLPPKDKGATGARA